MEYNPELALNYKNMEMGLRAPSSNGSCKAPILTGVSYNLPGFSLLQKCLSPGTKTRTTGSATSFLVMLSTKVSIPNSCKPLYDVEYFLFHVELSDSGIIGGLKSAQAWFRL